MKDDERICDRCRKFVIEPSQTVEYCEEQRFHGADRFYVEERINGNIKTCSMFDSIKEIKRNGR